MQPKRPRINPLILALALAAVLSGCTFFDSSVEQLFTLPRMAEEYTGLSQQIDSLIDQGYEYASPSGGRNIQSVQMVDLEDDGIQEALVFLRRSSDEKPLKIMVFRLEGDTYRCFCTIESSGSAVDSVYYQDLNGDGCREIIVGWRISADVQTLAAYTVESEPVALMSSGYTQFSVQDLNGDGVVDAHDEVAIGYSRVPEINYGFGLQINWKGLDFGAFFRGQAHVSYSLGGSFFPFANGVGKGNLFAKAMDRWSEENPNPNAFYPRLSASASANNQKASTRTIYDGSLLRLSDLEVGYTFRGKHLKSWGCQSLRVYFVGSNLLLFSPWDMWDPESGSTNGSNYPLARKFNLGVRISF